MAESKRAMLVNLNIRVWTARRYDKTVSAEVIKNNEADDDAGRFNKLLVSKEAIGKVLKPAGALRQWHYGVTLPWLDEGPRILPASMYFDYIDGYNKRRPEVEAAMKEFVDTFSDLKKEAAVLRKKMYNPADYPTDVASKFGIKLTFLPMPDEGDFRIELGEEEEKRIAESAKIAIESSYMLAQQDLWKRIADVTSHMVEVLNSDNQRFHQSLVGNVAELAEILPKLNFVGDTQINEVAIQMKQKLTAVAAASLKEDPESRARVAREAAEFLKLAKSKL